MPEPEVRAEGLVKSFGDHRVLAGVDLGVDRGEIVAIVGSSGCGSATADPASAVNSAVHIAAAPMNAAHVSAGRYWDMTQSLPLLFGLTAERLPARTLLPACSEIKYP